MFKEDYEDVVEFGKNALDRWFKVPFEMPCPIPLVSEPIVLPSIFKEEKLEERRQREKEYMRTKSHNCQSILGRKCIDKVVFENKHCIIVDNFGNRYIAKPEKGEKFDKEKGFLVALAKYNGFTTTKCQDLIKKAVDKDAKHAKKSAKKN